MTIESRNPAITPEDQTWEKMTISRSLRFFPIPGWTVETTVFSSKELEAEFDSLTKGIEDSKKKASAALQEVDTLTKSLNRAKVLLETTQKKLDQQTRKALKVAQLEGDLRSVQQTLHTTRHELGRSRDRVSTLERQQGKLKSSQTDLTRQLNEQRKQSKVNEKKWKNMKMKSDEVIELLERNLNQAETRSRRLEVVFSLLPQMAEIPYGHNSLSHKTGLPLTQKRNEISHPSMYAPSQPYERPSLETPLGVVRTLCLSKERGNVSKSQDACAFEYRDGRLFIGVADGVSTSHRQSEWAHRCVRSALVDNPYQAHEDQRKVHDRNSETFLELEPESTRWMAQAATGKKSDATLMRVDAGQDKVVLQRRGDVWAAAWNAESKEWRVVLSPSSEDGTMAVSSDEVLEFTDELTITKPSRLLLMTDGLNPTDQKGFNLLWEKLIEEDPVEFEAWLQKALAGTTFAEDDVTVVAVDFTMEEG